MNYYLVSLQLILVLFRSWIHDGFAWFRTIAMKRTAICSNRLVNRVSLITHWSQLQNVTHFKQRCETLQINVKHQLFTLPEQFTLHGAVSPVSVTVSFSTLWGQKLDKFTFSLGCWNSKRCLANPPSLWFLELVVLPTRCRRHAPCVKLWLSWQADKARKGHLRLGNNKRARRVPCDLGIWPADCAPFDLAHYQPPMALFSLTCLLLFTTSSFSITGCAGTFSSRSASRFVKKKKATSFVAEPKVAAKSCISGYLEP